MLRRIVHRALRAFVAVFVGTNVFGREHLPDQGPALVVANHNSHLDTVVLLSLFRGRQADTVRVAAAADYFFRKAWVGNLLSRLFGLIPISRREALHRPDESGGGVLDGIYQALDRGEIVILFPEGTRGEPGKLSPLKNGISKVAAAYPHVPVSPIYLKGTEKALPKGKKSFVPLIVNVTVHPPIRYQEMEGRRDFMEHLRTVFQAMGDAATAP